jgi:hypothetical protein
MPSAKPQRLPDQASVPTPIARLSGELLRLWEIDGKIDRTNADVLQVDDGPHDNLLPDGHRKRATFFEKVRKEAIARRNVLEQAIALEEPETLEDVLVLAILLQDAVDSLADFVDVDDDCDDVRLAMAVRAANGPRNLKDEVRRFEEQRRDVERLNNAIVRGLRRFASSPLADGENYWSACWHGRSWEEELALAEAEVAKLPVLIDD